MEGNPKYKDESLSFKERAEDLVSHMTVEECASQLLYGSAKIERLGVQHYNWWNEALHGVARAGMATVFPQAIGMAATFDDQLIGEVAAVIATEGRAKYNVCQKHQDYGIYKGLTYWSPNINIFRDPRWGRGQETYGEDPYLTAAMGVAFVKGLQGDDPRYLKAAACAKHFAVHSGPEKLRHEFDAVASKRDLAETYLPAFKALAEAGVEGFMGAYNRTNGEPCCGSKTLLVDLLRGEWGFDGYVTSDCWAIADFHQTHKVTNAATESAALALKNGCDLNCGTIYGYLLAAYDEGLVTEEEIRRSAVRLMTTRMKLGMFDEQTPFDSIPYTVVDCAAHRALNLEVARKSPVLLKNNGVLPLDASSIRNIAVIGPNANEISPLLGNYHGRANRYYTVLESIRSALGEGVQVNYAMGSCLYETCMESPGYRGDGLTEVKEMVDMADVAVLVVGLDETIEGEEMADKEFGGDKGDLFLPQCQRDLIEAACGRGTPVVLINMTGSAIDFGAGNALADAIIQAWYPGAMGGKALSDLLFGRVSPSGKLPVTFYHNDDPMPPFEEYSMEGRTYKYFMQEPLYPFGFGLTYTKFSYSIALDQAAIQAGDAVSGTVTVKNVGAADADAVVEWYLRDHASSVRVPRHKLCGIRRVFLRQGEEATLPFTIAAEQFAVLDDEGKLFYEPGVFTLFAGGCQPDEQSQALMGEPCASAQVVLSDSRV